jgi:lipoprotein-anchoring transpeptidase ErfK/SrfK
MLAAAFHAVTFVSFIGSAGAQDLTAVPQEPAWHPYRVTRADMRAAAQAQVSVYRQLFGEAAATVARFNRLDPRFVYPGTRLRVPDLPAGTDYVPLPAEYPRAAADERSILIVLDRQFLGAYEHGRLVASYPISSGRDDHPTPPGRYRVTKMDADHRSSVYPEPDGGWPMPWALRFRSSEYWIHGGELVGHPASHGCVRMFPEDAERLFGWASLGIRVRVVSSL